MSDLLEFQELGLSEAALEALRDKGFEKPTPIQSLTIPRLLAGKRDLIGQARTGTGKTAAFALPILERIERGERPQALILAPTRELCIQIADEINSLKGRRRLRVAPFYGGQPIEIQLQRLRDGVDLVVGTPGRILDLMRRNELDCSALRFAVLDEADEMLDMGFIEEIEAILEGTNSDKRMLMFSATMPDEIRAIAERFMHEPEIIAAAETGDAADAGYTEQFFYEVRREDKFEALCRIIAMAPEIFALIFCRTRVDADELTEKLNQRNFRTEALHGDLAQSLRSRVISRFKEKKFRLLVATDVAARGIDVNDLTHVINYSLPRNADTYIHRIGRTGRAGKRGVAISFVAPGETRRIAALQNEIKREIRRAELPTGAELAAAKKRRFSEELENVIAGDEHREYLDFATELLDTDANSPAEIIAALLRIHCKDELLEQSYPELGARRRNRNRREEFGDDGLTRVYIAIGKADSFGAVRMLDFLWERARIRKNRVGRIDCFDKFSFVNLEKTDAEHLIECCRQTGPRVQFAAEQSESRETRPPRNNRSEAVKKNFDPTRPAGRSERAERPERTEHFGRPERTERSGRNGKPGRNESNSETQRGAVRASRDVAARKAPAVEKKRRLREWVEKMSAGIEVRERRSPRRKKERRR